MNSPSLSVSVAVLGASGYSGAELLRYIAAHPSFEIEWVTAERHAGRRVGEVFGHLGDLGSMELHATDVVSVPGVDVAFLALPHGAAASFGHDLAARGIRVVDLSADWRLDDPATYAQWYGGAHPYPAELGGWVYGLPELYRDEISTSSRVANPGCYPTAALLALAPLVRERVIATERIVVDAVSGISGAGRKVDADYLFTELDASFKAYGVGKHRHTPEIEQELSAIAGASVLVTFTPHLAPMSRGQLVTCYARMTSGQQDVRDALETAYKGEPFVRVLAEGAQPATKNVSGSNGAHIGVGADVRTGTAIVTCAVDNLGKGAAGQAVQNANLMCGLDETSGLTATGMFP